MNICMIGHGMMGSWHTAAVGGMDCVLHTVVGRRPGPTQAFAEQYGYRRWTTDPAEALSDDQVDIVIVANPSELHAQTALAALEQGKHTLIEIPIALKLQDAEQVVALGEQRGLTVGVVHPLRMRRDFIALRERKRAGTERIRQVSGRFYIHRLENIGATGYVRSWTDNLLWHHCAHLVDAGLWLLQEPLRRSIGLMPSPDTLTGIPMEVVLVAETEHEQSLVCTGSYYGRERIFELLVVTDRDSYRLDVFRNTLTNGAGSHAIISERDCCAMVVHDFVTAVRERAQPAITGRSVLPAMQMLQQAQDEWDRCWGAQSLPGRPV